MEDLLRYHFVFDNFKYFSPTSLWDDIKSQIIDNFSDISASFNLTNEQKSSLIKLARSDRKELGLNKILPRFRARRLFCELLDMGILRLEKSFEVKQFTTKNQKLPRNLRRYRVQDKLHFRDNFTRFWFYFIAPMQSNLENKEASSVLELIKRDFEGYCGLSFELLCHEFLQTYLNIDSSQSFWNKDIEIDIFAKTSGGIIVAEAKFKERKVCKNILNLLEKKCERIAINPQIYILFSKSGFSKDLLKLRQSRSDLLLFELKDFALLIK